jgi:hypothetical protein
VPKSFFATFASCTWRLNCLLRLESMIRSGGVNPQLLLRPHRCRNPRLRRFSLQAERDSSISGKRRCGHVPAMPAQRRSPPSGSRLRSTSRTFLPLGNIPGATRPRCWVGTAQGRRGSQREKSRIGIRGGARASDSGSMQRSDSLRAVQVERLHHGHQVLAQPIAHGVSRSAWRNGSQRASTGGRSGQLGGWRN